MKSNPSRSPLRLLGLFALLALAIIGSTASGTVAARSEILLPASAQ